MSLEAVLAGLLANPVDHVGWLAIADCLEEQGEIERAELARLWALVRTMKPSAKRKSMERRVRDLVNASVEPCGPRTINSIGMAFALVPPGRFKMGSPANETGRWDNEQLHEVEITRPYFMAVFPVTQEEYQKVTGENPSVFSTQKDAKRFPVDMVSWNNALEFCRLLGERAEEKAQGRTYRLPTEAEWEYACRAGISSSQSFYFGDRPSSQQANFNGRRLGAGGKFLHRTCVVGSYRPNALGLHDMHGNIWEWCQDRYRAAFIRGQRCDPTGPAQGTQRVFRGGGWYSPVSRCRIASRNGDDPDFPDSDLGFRVVLDWVAK